MKTRSFLSFPCCVAQKTNFKIIQSHREFIPNARREAGQFEVYKPYTSKKVTRGARKDASGRRQEARNMKQGTRGERQEARDKRQEVTVKITKEARGQRKEAKEK